VTKSGLRRFFRLFQRQLGERGRIDDFLAETLARFPDLAQQDFADSGDVIAGITLVEEGCGGLQFRMRVVAGRVNDLVVDFLLA